MSDIEEPPSKVTKFEMESQYLEGEVMEEGQEEWLSEGVLTDDDYNQTAEQDKSGNTSQDDTAASLNDSIEHQDATMDSQDSVNQEKSQDPSTDQEMKETGLSNQESSEHQDNSNVVQDGQTVTEMVETAKSQNIEETLNNFENSQNNNQVQNDFPDDLDTFLIRKTSIKVTPDPPRKESEKDSDIDKSKHSDDDGNDTDDLLRMLGDAGNGKANTEKDQETSDDDDFVFERSNRKPLKVATSVLKKKVPAAKAVPEDDDVTDASSDEADTIKNIFGVTKITRIAADAKKAVKTVARPPSQAQAAPRKSTENSRVYRKIGPPRLLHSMPLRTTRRVQSTNQKSLLKPAATRAAETDEIIDTEQFKEEKKIDLTEEFTQKPGALARKPEAGTQRLMRPEQMDEEVPTDDDSGSDEESLYDELPSSDSDAMDEWFTLDIRAERAGDYLPMLGDNARKLLIEEKIRVAAKLSTLKQNLAALTDSGKEQAEQLRQATLTIAELDAALQAA